MNKDLRVERDDDRKTSYVMRLGECCVGLEEMNREEIARRCSKCSSRSDGKCTQATLSLNAWNSEG